MSASDQDRAESATDPGEMDSEETELSPEAELTRLQDEVAFYVDQLQRSRADFDNMRRRMTESRSLERRRMTVDIFRVVLPVYDDLRMAIDAEGSTEDATKLKEGLDLISDKFGKVLSEFGIEPIDAVGEAFDPAWHEAVFQEETSEMPAGHVLEIFERGYRCGEELLRPARVKVAMAPETETEGGEKEDV